ncbi:pantoate--beta-alanine ligase [Blastocystis sp. subtype 4]|uniref:pantoate--beta-alanine ligase n=1 Tax=Blastocystis sp. subtype 4 TaxID=944170 RepID=UPI0007120CD0|nr:pantoate--beta-alanine ligase [Blastocystis sp. subtype 4]KNB43083.1 pantoate--beta-alanine ligase [Blastocystis sp. subtype 4]|eukprot:XP_014526526.1 pantoate--beta-alanine ligase [Blastocystis sp. subtype 4]
MGIVVNKMVAEFYEKNHRFPTIGFVPTMGALHQGHLSLIKRVWELWGARENNDIVMASIFVNPKQFAPHEDFAAYPRTLEADCKLIESVGCDAAFAPTDEIMYPKEPKYLTYVTIEGSDSISEGAARPGFFRGVATVVTKLFNIVQPTNAYFGQKDGLQAIMVKQFVRDLNIPVTITVCPIVRAVDLLDGLALSSRNAYLSAEERAAAPSLYKSLCAFRASFEKGERDVEVLSKATRESLAQEPRFKIDYLSVANAVTAQELTGTLQEKDLKDGIFVSIAAWIGTTRLIDNIVLHSFVCF